MSASKKPSSCIGCPLEKKGLGYAKAVGPIDANILVVGEALGMQEALQGIPFVGEAGSVLDKCFRYTGIDRSEVRIDNTTRCKPPNNWLDGAPWEFGAIKHCAQNLDATLAEGHQVVVPVGGTAIHNLLGYSKKEWKSFKKPMENFHGTIHRDPTNRFWVVPSFHPSFIQRGNHKLIAVLMHDLLIAKEIAEKGHTKDPAILKVDPPVEWFLQWVDTVIARATECVLAGEKPPWLATDIETPEKAKGVDESEISVDDPSFVITRINFAVDFDLDFALTVPWSGPYIAGVKRLMNCEFLRKAFWNANYDRPRLNSNGCRVRDPWYDIMDAWHMLQSSLPKGLGFVAPFYSKYGAWKHLSSSNPGLYAAIDALQTVRCAVGIEKDLLKAGQWEAFERHGHLLDRYALKPAEDVGLRVEKGDPEKGTGLYGFQKALEAERGRISEEIAKLIPEKLLPLEGNYKRRPVDKETKEFKPEYFEVKAKTMTYKCQACQKIEVTKKHRCKERKLYEAEHGGKSPLLFDEWEISRWCVQGEFNPASSQQVLGYIYWKKHQPGKNKKTKAPSADVQVIEKLWKKHNDPFYEFLLDLRKIDKIKGTYVDGAIRQMDENGRIHTVFTNKPSTWRLSSQGFNVTNVVSQDKKEDKLGLGAKFRACVVPQKGCKLIELDYCVTPSTRILKQDLSWARAKELKVGDELIGFDEDALAYTKYKKSKVKRIKRIKRPCVRVWTNKGMIEVASNHPFLARNHKYAKEWVHAKDLKPGMLMPFCSSPWVRDKSREAGYLAGFFDGEGYLSRVQVGFGQNPGDTLDKVLALLKAKGIEITHCNNSSTAQAFELRGMWTAMRFLGTIGPERLLRKAHSLWEGRRVWGKLTEPATVVRIEKSSRSREVIAIETTTKTYISEGFFSHNSGIEAVQVGWFAADPQYIRLSKLGMHAFVTTYMDDFPEEPAQKEWGDKKLGDYLGYVKHEPKYKIPYNKSKRAVHGVAYGLTAYGLKKSYPELYPKTSDAQKVIDLILKKVAPAVYKWQESTKLQAHEQHFLGGESHPYKYKHWFWNVFNYKRVPAAEAYRLIGQGSPCVQHGNTWYQVTLGDDAKRAIAFFPQSTAGGNIREACLRLFTPGSEYYIGDVFYGKTPFRMPIHDSIVLEAPNSKVDYTLEKALAAMSLPIKAQPCPLEWGIGEYLTIGVDAEVGTDWAKMEKVD